MTRTVADAAPEFIPLLTHGDRWFGSTRELADFLNAGGSAKWALKWLPLRRSITLGLRIRARLDRN